MSDRNMSQNEIKYTRFIVNWKYFIEKNVNEYGV